MFESNESLNNMMSTIYQDADVELAGLLGWTAIQIGGQYNGIALPTCWQIGIPVGGKTKVSIPRWCVDNGNVFDLVIKYDLSIQFYPESESDPAYVCVRNLDIHGDEITSFDADWTVQHVSKELATKYAVVKAAILKIQYTNKVTL